MPDATMTMNTAEHLRSEAEHFRSREEVTVAAGTDGLVAGTVMGKITATGVYVQQDDTASDGSENAAGVLFEGVTGTAPGVVHVRSCQVIKAHLTYFDGATDNEKLAVDAELVALGIIPR